jgi:hypothetical protein
MVSVSGGERADSFAVPESRLRALLGAAVGYAANRDEASLARQLLHLLRPGMLVLLDRVGCQKSAVPVSCSDAPRSAVGRDDRSCRFACST